MTSTFIPDVCLLHFTTQKSLIFLFISDKLQIFSYLNCSYIDKLLFLKFCGSILVVIFFSYSASCFTWWSTPPNSSSSAIFSRGTSNRGGIQKEGFKICVHTWKNVCTYFFYSIAEFFHYNIYSRRFFLLFSLFAHHVTFDPLIPFLYRGSYSSLSAFSDPVACDTSLSIVWNLEVIYWFFFLQGSLSYFHQRPGRLVRCRDRPEILAEGTGCSYGKGKHI